MLATSWSLLAAACLYAFVLATNADGRKYLLQMNLPNSSAGPPVSVTCGVPPWVSYMESHCEIS